MSELLTLAVVTAVLIAVNGLYVAAEFALIGVRLTRIAQLAEDGNAAARALLPILRDPDRLDGYVAAAQIGITAASLVLGMYAEHQLADRFVPLVSSVGWLTEAAAHGAAIALAVGLLTYLHVVVGEMVPKSVALRHPEATAFGVARLMSLSLILFGPLILLFRHLGNLVLRLLRIPAKLDDEHIHSAGELAMVIGESAEGGLIAHREQQILLNIFDFATREAHQVMTPRTRIVAVPSDIEESELAESLAHAPHTRLPVYGEDLDHIIGTLHLRDFIRWRLAPDGPFDLGQLVRPARIVPEHMPAKQLLETFIRERGHMAIVIDEYGGTAGLVTLEDVAEELVGELRDEFDVESSPVETIGPGLLEVQGELQLVDLADFVALPEEHPNVDTVGGLVVNLLGRPAVRGDQVRLGALTLTAWRVSGLAVKTVRVAFEPGESETD